MSNQIFPEPEDQGDTIVQPDFYIAPDPANPTFTMPVFVGNTNDIVDKIEASGYVCYYILGISQDTIPYITAANTLSDKSVTNIALFKVVISDLGRSIHKCSPDEVNLKFASKSFINLNPPRIPYHLVRLMQTFFRSVDKSLHCESIVLLAYDPAFLSTDNPQDGWEIIVPEQTNTSAKCNYELSSIIPSLGDNLILMGSCHSHPGMAAYASGVDHHDQENWDGIHITMGWQSTVNSGETQYYVEIRAGGLNQRYDPRYVMDLTPPELEVDPESLKDLIAKVAVPASTYQNFRTPNTYPGTGGSASSTNTTRPVVTRGMVKELLPDKAFKLPNDAPDPTKSVIIGVAPLSDHGTFTCPFCESHLSSRELQIHRCYGCSNLVIIKGQNIADLETDRAEITARPLPFLNDPEVPCYIWTPATEKEQHDFVLIPATVPSE